MRKNLLFTLLLFAVTFINAQTRSRLTIGSSSPTAIKVIIDGHKFYSYDNRILINNLQSGVHTITLFYVRQRDYNNYFSTGNLGLWRRAFSRQVTIRNNFVYDITLNRFGRAFFDQELVTRRNNGNGTWDDDFENMEEFDEFDFEQGFDENYNDWDFFRNRDNSDFREPRGSRDPNFGGTGTGSGNFGNNRIPMSNSLFDEVKRTMQNQTFQSSRVEFAKQSVDNHTVTTSQVIELAKLLSMESDKLDFAKHAYDRTRDKSRFFTVINSFSMQSSKDELMEYIKDRR
jgi:hypothetical protein